LPERDKLPYGHVIGVFLGMVAVDWMPKKLVEEQRGKWFESFWIA